MEEIVTQESPKLDLPFSQGIVHNKTVYTSGQVPVDPDTGNIVGNTIEEQTQRTMENIDAILQAAGASLDNAVKATVLLDDIGDFDGFNNTYNEYVEHPYPARSAFEVNDLAIDILIEIEMIAALEY